MVRAAALLIVFAALVAWYETARYLDPISDWWAVALISVVLMPAMFGLTYLALPLRDDRRFVLGGFAVCLVGVLVFGLAGAPVFTNFSKFGAVTLAGWIFLWAFEALSWVVLIACVIPWVDAYSVWHGPTRQITENHPAVFTKLSIAFVVPGGGAARLGLPDVLFFSLFLAASARYGLRPFATWVAMIALLGVTFAATTFWADGGLPALPAIAVGFLVANADLLWTRLARPRLRALQE